MKTARIELRTDPEIKQLIQFAAALENTSDTEFIVKALKAASEKVINTSSTTILTEKQYKKLEKFLELGYVPNDNFKKLVKQRRKYVTGQL